MGGGGDWWRCRASYGYVRSMPGDGKTTRTGWFLVSPVAKWLAVRWHKLSSATTGRSTESQSTGV